MTAAAVANLIPVAEPKERRLSLPSGRQKLALSLAKAGYSYAAIGERMNISAQSAYELVARAKAAVAAVRRELESILEGDQTP